MPSQVWEEERAGESGRGPGAAAGRRRRAAAALCGFRWLYHIISPVSFSLCEGRLRLHGGRGQRGWAPGERAAVEQCLQLSPELDLLTSYTLWAGSPLTSEWLGVAYNRRQRAWEGYLDVSRPAATHPPPHLPPGFVQQQRPSSPFLSFPLK